MVSIKRKRCVLTMEQKLKAIERLERGESPIDLSKELGVGVSTVKDWRRNKDSIRNYSTRVHSERALSTRSTLRRPTNELVDDALWAWFVQERCKGATLSGRVLKEQALLIHSKLERTGEFSASSGWFERWKRRHGIAVRSVVDKAMGSSASVKELVKNKIKNRKEEEEEDNTPNESFAFVNVKEENISISSSEDCSIVEDDFTNNLNNTSSMSKSSRDPRPGDVIQGTPLPQQATSVTARRPHTLTTRQLPSQSHNTLTPQVPSQSHNTLTPQVPSQSHNTLTPQAPSQPLASPPGPSNALSDNSTEPLHKKPKLSKQTELLDLACTYLIEKCSGQKQPPEEGDDEFLMIAKVWAKKLRALDPLQRKFAEKYVNDILFEADIGTLNRDSVKINRS